jgi:hypothetical protein
MDQKVASREDKKQEVAIVGDQEVMSHTISKEMVGKSRRGFPTGTKL